MASDDQANNRFLKEWEIARFSVENCDKHLHDLRKYGFSFLTALLTAESFLIPTWLPSSNSSVLPDYIKVAVLLVDLILIVALSLIDRNYLVVQGAAATRARILERILNLELTDVISFRYTLTNVKYYVAGVYVAFTLGVLVLGVSVLYPNYIYIVFLGLVAIIVQFLVVKFVHLRYEYGRIDWTLDRLQCNSGDEVGITLTNLGEKPIEFKPGDIMWWIMKEDDESVVEFEELDKHLFIIPEDSYTWLWKTEGVQEGIYRVYRVTLKERGCPFWPLKRKVRIRKPSRARRTSGFFE